MPCKCFKYLTPPVHMKQCAHEAPRGFWPKRRKYANLKHPRAHEAPRGCPGFLHRFWCQLEAPRNTDQQTISIDSIGISCVFAYPGFHSGRQGASSCWVCTHGLSPQAGEILGGGILHYRPLAKIRGGTLRNLSGNPKIPTPYFRPPLILILDPED